MGGGEGNIFLKPVKQLKSITMTDLGVVESVVGWSFTAGNLPQRVAEQMTLQQRDIFRRQISQD